MMMRRFLPATIGQKITIPSLELMRTTDSIKNLLPRFQAKMICIVQAEHTPRFAQLVICQAFEGRLRCDRHKNRQRDGAVGKVEGTRAGFRSLSKEGAI